MSWLDWDIRDARAAAAKEGRAEGKANERSLMTQLIGAMESAGCDSSEIVAAMRGDDLDSLYAKYGIDTTRRDGE